MSNYPTYVGYPDAEAIAVITCSTVALYNSIEILFLIFVSFKKWTGLYFWSLLVASSGVIPYNIGFVLFYFHVTHNWVGFIFSSYGWAAMVTGQSVVLYSRLHLVTREVGILRAVKWIIIFDAIAIHIPTTIMLFGSNYGGDMRAFGNADAVNEKVQMTVFGVQEFIISGIYLRDAFRLLGSLVKARSRGVMWQLLPLNIIIIFMDIFLLVLEYRNLRVLEQTSKGLIYSIKLKMEFAILGKLVEVVQSNSEDVSRSLEDT